MSENKNLNCEKCCERVMLEKYLHFLEEKCADFKEAKDKYLKLEEKIENRFKYTDKLIQFLKEKLEYEILYSFNVGYKDGIAHNPEENFWYVEYEKNFKEMYRQKEYRDTDNSISQLVRLMSDDAKILYFDMLEYYTFLEVYIPKMAHFHGYLVSSVAKNSNLCKEYSEWLGEYLDFCLTDFRNSVLN